MPCTSAKRKYDAKYGRDIPRSVYQSWGAVVSKERGGVASSTNLAGRPKYLDKGEYTDLLDYSTPESTREPTGVPPRAGGPQGQSLPGPGAHARCCADWLPKPSGALHVGQLRKASGIVRTYRPEALKEKLAEKFTFHVHVAYDNVFHYCPLRPAAALFASAAASPPPVRLRERPESRRG